MRALDNWNVYFVEGKPFFGRFTFYKLHTTTKVEITDENGTPLDNPIQSDIYGRTSQQVFLPDEDVTVVLETYIGGANMSDDQSNISAWSEALTFDSLKSSLVIVTGGGVSFAQTMEDLRELDTEGVESVFLLGYYELGDMPPVLYTRKENSSQEDNGGSRIRINTREVWELTPNKELDVRVFGVFPGDSLYNIQGYDGQLRNAFDYANTYGLDIYFPQVYDGECFYYIEGGSHILSQTMHADTGVHIVAKANTISNINVESIDHIGSQLFISQTTTPVITGNLTVNTNTVRTSWKGNSWASWRGSASKVIVDSLNSGFSFTDQVVEVVNNIENVALNFTRCEISSKGKIGSNCTVTLDNCGVVSDKWFNGTNTISLSGNTIQLDQMSSADVYIDWKNKQHEADYGDLGEQTVSNKTLSNGAIAENASFNNVTLAGSSELHNISGSVSIGNTVAAHNWIDCWISGLSDSAVITDLSIRRGSISGASAPVILGNVLMDNVSISAPLDIRGGSVYITNSTINSPIAHIGSPIIETITNTVFNAQVNISGGGTNVVVQANWINNIGNVVRPIFLNRTNLNPTDSAHSYRYEGNSGTFSPSKEVILETMLHITTSSYPSLYNSDDYVLIGTPNGVVDFPNVFFAQDKYPTPEQQAQYAPPHGLSNSIDLFRVGTDDCDAIVSWIPKSATFGGADYPPARWTVIPVEFPMVFKFQTGDTYKLRIPEYPVYNQGGANYWTTPIALWRASVTSDYSTLTITGRFLAKRI